MEYMYVIIGSLVVITCFYFVISPFFGKANKLGTYESNGELSVELIYASINELEMDYLMRKITKEDFEEMKRKYLRIASEQLKGKESKGKLGRNGQADHSNVPGVVHSEAVDDDIMRELQKIRRTGRG